MKTQARRTACALGASLLLAGCAGAFGRSMERGDGFARAGNWDAAAAEYRKAVGLRPADDDAAGKLHLADAERVASRLEQADRAAAHHDFSAALNFASEALAISPDDAAASATLARHTTTALDRAEAALGPGGDAQIAADLSSAVLRVLPNDGRARALAARVRVALAERRFERAARYREHGLPGAALAEFAACLGLAPEHARCREGYDGTRAALERDLRFVVTYAGVQLERGPGAAPAGKPAPSAATGVLAAALAPERLAAALEPRLLIDVVRTGGGSGPGMALAAALGQHVYAHAAERVRRTCSYLCGTDTQSNPDRERRERDLASAEGQLSSAESAVGNSERELTRAESDLAAVERDVTRQDEEVSRARADLDRCLGSSSRPPPDCGSERSRVQSEESRLADQRRRLDGPRDAVQRSRDSLNSARGRRDAARGDRDRERDGAYGTPSTITVDRYCDYGFDAVEHSESASVMLGIAAAAGGAASPAPAAAQPIRAEAADETRASLPGPCSELASDDPLELPTEAELDAELARKLLAQVRGAVEARYALYRGALLSEGRRQESAARFDLALENYVRYVLTSGSWGAQAGNPVGTSPGDVEDEGRIAALFAKAAGLGGIAALLAPPAVSPLPR